MKAVVYTEYGGPEVLHVAEVDEPHAGAGQIRIAVRGAGVNPFDWKLRSGAMAQGRPLEEPRIPGSDASGVVDEVGEGVDGVSAGDALFGFTVGGASAEYALLGVYARKPSGLSFEEAAGYPVAVETAIRGLDLLGVGAGDTLLVNGATGGVGSAVVQFAVARGARVIGIAGERNHDYLRQLGAEPVAYGEGMTDRVRELAPDGVDYAFDVAGSGVIPELIELAGSPDNVISIADFSAPEHGVRVTSGRGDRAAEALAEAARLHEEGRFSIPIERTFPFSQAAEAHRLSETGHVRGKIVLVPD